MHALWIAGALALGMPVAAEACWATTGGVSYHFNRTAGYNERNPGLGVECPASEEVAIVAGTYRNSVRANTRYAGVFYQPLRIGPVRFGVEAGVMDGYPTMNKGGPFLAAIPMASLEGKHMGVNVGLIPTLRGKVDGAVIVQFKWRF